jgi:hypothetical protein
MNTTELYREREFYCLGEIEEWISRDYYGNDLQGLLAVFQELKYTVNEWLDRAKESGIEIPKHWDED